MEKTNVIGKKELIAKVAKKLSAGTEIIPKFETFFNNIFDTIVEEVAAGNRIEIYGVGQFKPVGVAERKGRNPQTGEEITIPAHKKVVFSPSKRFKEKVNGQI
mgnify:CR=1 FL=1